MHRAFDSAALIDEAANERTATMRTTVIDSVDRPLQVKEGDVDVVDLDELAAIKWQLLEPTSFDPVLRFGQGR